MLMPVRSGTVPWITVRTRKEKSVSDNIFLVGMSSKSSDWMCVNIPIHWKTISSYFRVHGCPDGLDPDRMWVKGP